MKISEVLENYDNDGWKFEVVVCNDDYGIALTYDIFDGVPSYCVRMYDYLCQDNVPRIIRFYSDKETAEKAYNILTTY